MKRTIDFLKYRYIAIGFSIALAIICITGTIIKGGFNYGIDFVGGIKIIAKFKDSSVKEAQLRTLLKEFSPTVQQIGSEDKNEFIISTKLTEKERIAELEGTSSVPEKKEAAGTGNDPEKESAENKPGTEVQAEKSEAPAETAAVPAIAVAKTEEKKEKLTKAEKVKALLTLKYNKEVTKDDGTKGVMEGVIFLSDENVGPAIGDFLRKSAVKLFLIAVILMTFYLTFRFEFKYSVGAMAALVHDIFLSILFCGLVGVELNIPVIAALLTIFGYSVNDSIVVFDRVRENVQVKSKLTFIDVINKSISLSISRTLLTSLTTLFTVSSLYFIGGEVLNEFALVLLFGIFVGTYSSVYVASPVLLTWEKFRAK
ncbi:MAG: protein translocase subunit SecF [bacterium]|nr:protein translocase subunit SecF [bacterium]